MADREFQIRINTHYLKVREHDLLDTILLKYAISRYKQIRTDPKKLIIPIEGYRWDRVPTKIEERQDYVVKTVLDDLPESIHDVMASWSLWLQLYPNMLPKDLFILYTLREFPLHRMDLQTVFNLRLNEILSTFERSTDINLTVTEVHHLRRQWSSTMQNIYQTRETRLLQSMKLDDKINLMKSVDFSPLRVKKITYQYYLNYTTDMPLFIIFQEAILTSDLPYLIWRQNGKTQYKIKPNENFPQSYILRESKNEIIEDGLYFHVHGQDAYWSPSHILNIEYTKIQDLEDTLELVWDSLQFTFNRSYRPLETKIQPTQIRVKGDFQLLSTEVEPLHVYMLADVLSTNPIAIKYLWVNESRRVISKNPTHVPVTYTSDVYQESTRDQRIKAMIKQEEIQIIDEKKKVEKRYTLHVNISRAPNITMIESFRLLFGKLLYLTYKDQEELIELYESYDPSLKRILSKPPIHIKQTTKHKMGDRLKTLQEHYPDLFGKFYSRECGANKQPIIIPPNEVENYINILSQPTEAYPEGGPGRSGVIEYEYDDEKVYYGCQTAEEYKAGQYMEFRYPGLKENKTHSAELGYEYIPCCYQEDQYENISSGLYRYLKSKNRDDDDEIKIKKRTGMGYILRPNKRVVQDPDGEHRWGLIPTNIEWIYREAGINQTLTLPDTKTKQFPLMRMGVVESPSSLLHACEYSFNPNYKKLDYKERIEHVNRLRIELSNLDLTLALQELYPWNLEEAKAILEDPEEYLDPGKWIRLIEFYYKTHLFLFEVSLDKPDGEFYIPNRIGPYLHVERYDRAITMIVHRARSPHIKPQCELLVQLLREDTTRDKGDEGKGKGKGKRGKRPVQSIIIEHETPLYITLNEIFKRGYRVYQVRTFHRR